MAASSRAGRRTGAGLAVLVLFVLIVGSCEGDGSDQPSASGPSPTAPAARPPGACPGGDGQTGEYSAQGGCHVDGERVTIAGVHDAATYVLTDGRRVRLAGVLVQAADTCGGSAALRLVGTHISAGQVVNIVRGAGLDPFGSRWVHVQLGRSYADLGALLARYGYAEAYSGGAVSTSYVPGLAATVDAAKSAQLGQFGPPCTVPPPAVVAAPPTPEERAEPLVRAPGPRATRDDEHDEDDPAPPKRRTGRSGHPCLPGERDGDGDGYCGEGR